MDSLGYMCETHDNPADFLLDVINKCEGQLSATSDLLAIEERNDGDGSRRVDLAEAYANSIFYNTTLEKCQQYKDGVAAHGQRKKRRSPPKYATNIIWQLIVVLIRSIVNLARNPMTSILQFVIVTLFSVIVGGIYFQLDTSQNGYQNRVGAIFFIIMNQIFGNLSAIDLFIRQKHLFIHENASGFYRVSAYFIAKVVCDIIPMRILPLCLFAPITYFMIGFQIEVDRFFIYFLTLVLVSIAASSSAFWVSAGVRVAGIANLLVALTYVVQMVSWKIF
jgi:ATP-binding cassette subfamily G (WHITE) protein 2